MFYIYIGCTVCRLYVGMLLNNTYICNTQLIYIYIYICYTVTHAYNLYQIFTSAIEPCALTAAHCNTLQHTATHCNTLQHTTAWCTTLQHNTKHCNTLRRPRQQTHMHCGSATYSTLHHTAPHCTTLHHTATEPCALTATHCNAQLIYI